MQYFFIDYMLKYLGIYAKCIIKVIYCFSLDFFKY